MFKQILSWLNTDIKKAKTFTLIAEIIIFVILLWQLCYTFLTNPDFFTNLYSVSTYLAKVILVICCIILPFGFAHCALAIRELTCRIKPKKQVKMKKSRR